MTFAIVGITGNVGRVVGQTLLERHKRVRAIVRDEAKGQVWADKGAEVAVADLHDPIALQRAFKDVEGVFVMTPPAYVGDIFEENERVVSSLITAIEAAKVPKVIALSSVGAHLPIGTGTIKKHYDLEQAFKKHLHTHSHSTKVAFLRAAWFFENFLGAVDVLLQSGNFYCFLSPKDHKIPMVATQDVGRAAAEYLLDSTWNGCKVVDVRGPSECSPDDIVETLERCLGMHVNPIVINEEDQVDILKDFEMGEEQAAVLAEMHIGFSRGWITFEPGAEQFTGALTFDDVLQTHDIEQPIDDENFA